MLVDIVHVLAAPILHAKRRGVRCAPVNAHGIHGEWATQVHNHPLWEQRVRGAGEAVVEVRVALPKRDRVAVVEAREAGVVDFVGGSASRQSIAVRQENRRGGRIVGQPIAALVRRIAPASTWIPVPALNAKLCAQADGGHGDADGLHGGDVRAREDERHDAFAVAVESAAEGGARVKAVHGGAFGVHRHNGVGDWRGGARPRVRRWLARRARRALRGCDGSVREQAQHERHDGRAPIHERRRARRSEWRCQPNSPASPISTPKPVGISASQYSHRVRVRMVTASIEMAMAHSASDKSNWSSR